MEVITKTSNSLFTFDSISEFTRHVTELPSTGRKGRSSEQSGSRSWDNGVDLQGAIKMGEDGGVWAEGAAKIAPVTLPESELTREMERLTIETSMVGALPCVPNMLCGLPDSMLNIETTGQQKRVLRIGIEIVRPCGVTTDEILNQGTAILSILDALETSGVSVELWACYHLQTSDKRVKARLQICIKKAGDFWDADAVAFALAHPAFARRLVFRFMENTFPFNVTCGGGYGGAHGSSYDDFDISTPYLVPSECSTKQGAIDYYVNHVVQQMKAKEA
jgi:hypothetical protein